MNLLDKSLLTIGSSLLCFIVFNSLDSTWDKYNDKQSNLDYQYFRSLDHDLKKTYFNMIKNDDR